jgi:hypothetical protein
MIAITGTNETIEFSTASAVSTDWTTTFIDSTATTHTPSSMYGNVNTATTTTIIPSGIAATYRKVAMITITNIGASSNQITLNKDVGGTNYKLFPQTILNPGESLQYNGDKFTVYDNAGNEKVAEYNKIAGAQTRVYDITKIGTTAKGAGTLHMHLSSVGIPCGWDPTAVSAIPASSGRVVDGTSTSDAGVIPFVNATVGTNYLVYGNIVGTVVCTFSIYDLLWISSGLNVTTTTAQGINSVSWPNRDANGTANGEGVIFGLWVQVQTTNAISPTFRYTNSRGVSGRTGTMATVATATAGSLFLGRLQAGDTGIRSIQSITLGASLGAGTVYYVALRKIYDIPNMVANTGNFIPYITDPGIKLYNGTAMIIVQVPSTTTATNLFGCLMVSER